MKYGFHLVVIREDGKVIAAHWSDRRGSRFRRDGSAEVFGRPEVKVVASDGEFKIKYVGTGEGDMGL